MMTEQAENQPRLYVAAPLFNPIERRFNEKLAARLSRFCRVFLPQRDGQLLKDLVSKEGIDINEARRIVFDADTQAIREAHVVVAVLDGRGVDEGVAVELGFASALGKICVGFKTDDRVALPTGDNPMVLCACNVICHSTEEIEAVVSDIADRINGNRSSPPPSQLNVGSYRRYS